MSFQLGQIRGRLWWGILFVAAQVAQAAYGGTTSELNGNSREDIARERFGKAESILSPLYLNETPLYVATDYAQAADLLESAAAYGHAGAAAHLGSLFLSGKGFEKSVGQACRWYGRALFIWFEGSFLLPVGLVLLFILGGLLLFRPCRGVHSVVAKWKTTGLLRHSKSETPQSQYKLALRYLHGKGGQKWLVDAKDLFEKSAENGFAPAQV